ncbi:hypothetical protein [Pseudonocardia humida]|uniref:Peptidoglycan/LPS O-acetylase OafA/YrhL n=1 Tax=Pseudonocardia humida TaxID=2800819 RepID=A0ABT1A509_9PSEU|nr:hypothetical protein [Pseudonocardia humida]MCO1658087.1 hypothetical protein [Pseudonocardia humida]
MLALGGLAVLLVVLQGSGGFTVELLGADLLLAVAGFRVTHALLEAAVVEGRAPLRAWYGQQLGHRVALLAIVLGVVLLAAAAGRPEPAAQAGLDALAGLPGGGNWWLHAERTGLLDAHGLPRDWYADRPGTVDPLGVLWLVGLLVQLGLGWPLVLVPLRALLRVRTRRAALTRLLPALVALAYLAWLVGPLRTAGGAPVAELALGTHVRAAEFLLGAVAAVAAVGLHGRRIPAWVAPVLAVVGVGGLVALAVLATWYPVDWLRRGGPTGAAAGAALLLLAVQLPGHGPVAAALGRGLPLELGRVAYPLLLLHLPAFWLVQRGVPTVRPAALLLVGTALAWLVGLLLQDGLLRRWRARWRAYASVPLVVLAVLAVGAGGAGLFLRGTDVPPQLPGPPRADRPVVLVLGGSTGGDLAAALAAAGDAYAVRDATRPGCGLLPTGLPEPERARLSAWAQLPGPAQPPCAGWAARWRDEVAALRPVAVLLDLGSDAAPARVPASAPTPCRPGFRTFYRQLLDDAVRALGTGPDAAPVLLADARAGTGAARCFNALVAEAVATHPTLVPLDVEALVCPGGVCAEVIEFGHPSSDTAHLSTSERDEVGPWLAAAVRTELAPERAAARAEQAAGTCPAATDRGVDGAGC